MMNCSGRLGFGLVAVVAVVLSLSVGVPADDRPISPIASGTGPIVLPPLGVVGAPVAPPTSPTLHRVGPLDILVHAATAERFVLRLRRTNGDVVDIGRVAARHPAVMFGPVDEVLLLDVLPLDAGVPVIGLPVTTGGTVVVGVSMRESGR